VQVETALRTVRAQLTATSRLNVIGDRTVCCRKIARIDKMLPYRAYLAILSILRVRLVDRIFNLDRL
jgi:hypothetical protein